MTLPTVSSVNTSAEHISHHNTLHGFFNAYEGTTPATFATASHNHAGSAITSGTVGVNFIGTGTKNGTTFYAGDGTFKSIVSGGAGAPLPLLVAASNAPQELKDIAQYVSDGTNDQQDIADALKAAAGARPVLLSQGTFQWQGNPTTDAGFVDSSGRFLSAGFLAGVNAADTIIQLASGVSRGPSFAGTRSTAVGGTNPLGPSTNIAVNATSFTMASTIAASNGTIAAGDYINITSGAVFGSRTYYTTGEIAKVRSVSGLTVNLQWPTRFAYNTADSIQIFRYAPITCSLRDFTVRGHSSATVQHTMIELSYTLFADVHDVWCTNGDFARVGLELKECINPRVYNTRAQRVMDLNRIVVVGQEGFEGYGIRTGGCLDARFFDTVGEDCRHAVDDSAGSSASQRVPPSLRSQFYRAVAVQCRAAGISTHGGSDECEFFDPTCIGCGGGGMFRGRAQKIHQMTVYGTHDLPYEYSSTTTSDPTQSTVHAVRIGEPIDPGEFNWAGTQLEISFKEVDLAGFSGARAVYCDPETPINKAWIHGGRLKGYSGVAMLLHGPTIRDLTIEDIWFTTPSSNSNRIIEINPSAGSGADGDSPKRVLIQNNRFDGYGASGGNLGIPVWIKGNSANTAANLADVIRVLNNSFYNKVAGMSASQAIILLASGWFSTTAGAVEVSGNDLRESSACFSQSGASNSTPTTGIRGNTLSTGYDTAP